MLKNPESADLKSCSVNKASVGRGKGRFGGGEGAELAGGAGATCRHGPGLMSVGGRQGEQREKNHNPLPCHLRPPRRKDNNWVAIQTSLKRP